MKSVAYVAFLRGVNVGGNAMIGMEALKKAFSSLGVSAIKTVLASGNVIFESGEVDVGVLTARIEQMLQSDFGLQISVILRTGKEIQSLVNSKPFKQNKVTPQTRFLMTFLSEPPPCGLKISQRLTSSDFGNVRFSDRHVCSAIEVSPGRGTSDLMKLLQKEFGKKITTRTWNTVERIAKLL